MEGSIKVMGSLIAACGNDCAVCPRFTVYPYEKTDEEEYVLLPFQRLSVLMKWI